MKVVIELQISPPFLHIVVKTPDRVITLSNTTKNPLRTLIKVMQDLIYTTCQRGSEQARNRLYVRTLNELSSMSSYRKRRSRQAQSKEAMEVETESTSS